MNFNSTEYAILLTVSFALVWLLADRPRLRTWVLLAASYTFYACWSVKYLGLIALSSTSDYMIGKKLHNTDHPTTRKLLMGLSLVVDLGILATFKYFNFFTSEFANLMSAFGVETSPPVLHLLLPVGISFYTFQTLSYTIDIYRRALTPTRSYFQYLLFVSFFPQLVAGPIVRASKLLPQLQNGPRLTADAAGRAVFLIAIGLLKKTVVADYLGIHLVEPVFSNPAMYSSLETLVAVYAYAFQIYADFSAYSDIAIGSAALLGFEIPLNLNDPYTAVSLRDFWQRWHISLSTWLRDYLYIPMGGSRKGHGRTYVHLLATMVIGGLWHGAALTFVFWGLIHGLALVVTRAVQRKQRPRILPPMAARFFGVILTFHVVCAAWIFFRADSFSKASEIFAALWTGGSGIANIAKPATLVLAGAMLAHWIPSSFMETARARFSAFPAGLQASVVVAVILLSRFMAQTDVTPFIYFQF